MDLGSRPWQVLFDVTLPVIFPAILAGWLQAFTISLDDVVITSFTTGPGSTTLPLLIWSKVKFGVTPDINALATLIVLAAGLAVALSGWIMNRARYAVAMTMFQTGQIGAAVLEVYRIAAASDTADPADQLRDFGLTLPAPASTDLQIPLHTLVREIDRYIATLTGPHGWRFGPDRPLTLKPAHHPVWNPPYRPHLTKVGPTPFPAIFARTREVNQTAKVIQANDWPQLETRRLSL